MSNHFLSNQELNNQLPPVSPYVIRRFSRADSAADFDLAAAVRREVFVDEQGFPLDEEQDEYDDNASHWLIFRAETLEPLATARMAAYQEGCQMRPVAKIGRVAVKRSMRGQRLGDLLMREIMLAAAQEGFEYAILDAQLQALPFYEKCGFVAEGDEYLDTGVPHYRMRCLLP